MLRRDSVTNREVNDTPQMILSGGRRKMTAFCIFDGNFCGRESLCLPVFTVLNICLLWIGMGSFSIKENLFPFSKCMALCALAITLLTFAHVINNFLCILYIHLNPLFHGLPSLKVCIFMSVLIMFVDSILLMVLYYMRALDVDVSSSIKAIHVSRVMILTSMFFIELKICYILWRNIHLMAITAEPPSCFRFLISLSFVSFFLCFNLFEIAHCLRELNFYVNILSTGIEVTCIAVLLEIIVVELGIICLCLGNFFIDGNKGTALLWVKISLLSVMYITGFLLLLLDTSGKKMLNLSDININPVAMILMALSSLLRILVILLDSISTVDPLTEPNIIFKVSSRLKAFVSLINVLLALLISLALIHSYCLTKLYMDNIQRSSFTENLTELCFWFTIVLALVYFDLAPLSIPCMDKKGNWFRWLTICISPMLLFPSVQLTFIIIMYPCVGDVNSDNFSYLPTLWITICIICSISPIILLDFTGLLHPRKLKLSQVPLFLVNRKAPTSKKSGEELNDDAVILQSVSSSS